MKAIFGFFERTVGVFKISLTTACDAISSSVYCLAGAGGSQSEIDRQLPEEKM